MVVLGEVEPWERVFGLGVGSLQRADAGHVAGERHHHHVHHQLADRGNLESTRLLAACSSLWRCALFLGGWRRESYGCASYRVPTPGFWMVYNGVGTS